MTSLITRKMGVSDFSPDYMLAIALCLLVGSIVLVGVVYWVIWCSGEEKIESEDEKPRLLLRDEFTEEPKSCW